MKRKRDSLLSIGDAVSGLDGPVNALRKAAPQALSHFTQTDQVDQLVWASEQDPEMGFMARMMALCSLPRTNPGNQLQYKRVNGPYTLGMSAGINNKLPYGSLPRLLLAWVCTEAVRTQSRVLVLGPSLSEFMRKLDLHTSGGSSRGDRTRLQNQMKRLFYAHVQLIYEGQGREQFISSQIADRGEFWWDPKRPDEPSLWQSKIELGEKFFQEIIQHPVPLDMNILKAMKRSSLGLDLVSMAHLPHLFTLQCPLRLSWPQPLPPVRDCITAQRQETTEYREQDFRTGLPAGVDQDQDGLAEYALRDGQGRTDPLTLKPRPSRQGSNPNSRNSTQEPRS